MRAELGVDAPVVATGGLAGVIASNAPIIQAVDPHLSLYGLHAFAVV
jgi:pantothenate kinase type III